MILFNDLDQIYSLPPHASAGGYQCPVCQKDFTTPVGAERHHAKRKCHRLCHIFEGTVTETAIYDLYRAICRADGRRPLKMENFRPSRFYTLIGKFFLYCINNGVTNPPEYFWFSKDLTNPEELVRGTALALNDRVLGQYRAWKINNVTDEQSRNFYELNSNALLTNITYAIRCMEKGEISPRYYFSRVDRDEFVKASTAIQAAQLSQVMAMYDGRKV